MVLSCTGQPVRMVDNQPTGTPCGAVYTGLVDSARFTGWRVGPEDQHGDRPAMCPSCARPDTGAPVETGMVQDALPGL